MAKNLNTLLGENTYIPVTFVAVSLSTIAGGIIWLTMMYSLGQANQVSVQELKAAREADRQAYMQFAQSIDHRLSRIEGKLGVNGD